MRFKRLLHAFFAEFGRLMAMGQDMSSDEPVIVAEGPAASKSGSSSKPSADTPQVRPVSFPYLLLDLCVLLPLFDLRGPR